MIIRKQISKSKKLLKLAKEIKADLLDAGGNTATRKISTILYNNQFQLIALYRISRTFKHTSFAYFCGPIRWMQYVVAGSEISPESQIGHNVRFPHPTGIVIGAGAIVQDGACLFQNVTIGSHGKTGESKVYPIVEENATIFAGAKVIGDIKIGSGATIGANAVVTKNIPPNSVAVGIPAKVL